MKVIFVASGNKKVGQVNAFVRSQYESLEKEGLEMRLFPVVGHGVMGYLKAVVALRNVLKQEHPDIIHAHYSTCGFVATLATLCMRKRPKIVVSILGSFPTRNGKWRRVRWAIQHLWDGALTKSERTRKQLDLELPVIPNGVNLDIFHPIDQSEARKTVGFENGTKYIIWCSNPERPEKDWALAVEGVRELENEGIRAELVAVYNKTPEEVCTYMNAADCLLLTSVSEGSPNVIKEAMACNCPIVTTDVGDVNERLANLEGCFIVRDNELVSERVSELGRAIGKALEFGKRTDGRKRLLDDKLEISQIAKRIIEVYGSI